MNKGLINTVTILATGKKKVCESLSESVRYLGKKGISISGNTIYDNFRKYKHIKGYVYRDQKKRFTITKK